MSKYSITLIPSISQDALPMKKCNPTRNNNRRKQSYNLPQMPTPHYTYRILEDVYYTECLTFLHKKIKECPSLIDAILIAKTWIAKRDLNKYSDTINGFLFSMLYLYLFNIKILNNEMEASHIFKVTLNYINTNDISSIIMTIDPSTNRNITSEIKTNFQKAYTLTLLSSDLQFNIMGRISKSAYQEVFIYI